MNVVQPDHRSFEDKFCVGELDLTGALAPADVNTVWIPGLVQELQPRSD